MFLLKDREDLMGENLINLIGTLSLLFVSFLDPNFKKTTTEAEILKAFGLGLDSQDSGEVAASTNAAKPAEAEQTEQAEQPAKPAGKGTVLTAVRMNGDVFSMRVTVVKVNNNVLTAKLEDTNEPTIEMDVTNPKDRTMSSSSFSSYQDTFSSQRSGSLYSSSLYRSSLGSFAGVVVDMNEIDDESQWVGTGRYTAGREEVYREVSELKRYIMNRERSHSSL